MLESTRAGAIPANPTKAEAAPLETTGNLVFRKRRELLFRRLAAAVTWSVILILGTLLYRIAADGLPWLSLEFLSGTPSRFAHKSGIYPALLGTAWLMGLTALFSIPLGVAAAIYLEEYASRGRFTRIVELNIANLAGTPSIVLGLLGLTVFVRFFGLGRSLMAGALTLTLMILPTIIIASREALRAVPHTIRQAAYAVGATRWQTVRGQVVPAAIPGIMTGIILALSRAIGETAPLIVIGALSYVAFAPSGPMDQFTTLPIVIFNWASRPKVEFQQIAAAAILVLLTAMLLMNLTAIMIRQRAQRRHRQ
ncbi:MAG: phosphate ABC transporter permease PstA [Bdellovibrionales bacterium]|nr:phosphate ABC transporter permease PstA [Bdellovibrionales bacterium]